MEVHLENEMETWVIYLNYNSRGAILSVTYIYTDIGYGNLSQIEKICVLDTLQPSRQRSTRFPNTLYKGRLSHSRFYHHLEFLPEL